MITKRRFGICAPLAIASLTLLAACGSSSSSGGTKAAPASGPIRGETINVAIAYPAPKALLAKFTQQTGVNVNWSYVQWDDLQTKIASAAEAHTYFADVADVDWSKVGEYYQTKWFMPLNAYFNVAAAKTQYPQLSTFVRNGSLVGMPMDAEFLVTTINKKDLQAAGIRSVPTTIAQYTTDLTAIHDQTPVKCPLDIPFSAAEGLSTYWYELTAAFGGQVLSSTYKPEFTDPASPGYKAMAWMVNAYKSGIVPAANLSDEDYQAFESEVAHNVVASVFSDYSGDLATIYNLPSDSSVVHQMEYIPTPGVTGVASNLGNPDGIGIPADAEHVAAAVAFIKWMEEPANQAAFAGADGPADVINTFPLPDNDAGIADLLKSGKAPGTTVLANLLEKHSRAIFPAGAPPWYAEFSNSVYTNIHSVIAGQESLGSAIAAISSTVNGLNS